MHDKKLCCLILLVFVIFVSSQQNKVNKKSTSKNDPKIDLKKISSLYTPKPNSAQTKKKETKSIPTYKNSQNKIPNWRELQRRDALRQEEMNHHRKIRKAAKRLKAKLVPTKPSIRKYNKPKRNIPNFKRNQGNRNLKRNVLKGKPSSQDSKYKKNEKYIPPPLSRERRNSVQAPRFKSPSYYGKTIHDDHEDYYHDEDPAHEVHDEFVDHPSVKNYRRSRDEL
jgi:hypothetical protein